LLNFRQVIAPSTNISTEEMTVTPVMPLSTSDAASSLINQGENVDIYVDSEPTGLFLDESEIEPLLVEPETEPTPKPKKDAASG